MSTNTRRTGLRIPKIAQATAQGRENAESEVRGPTDSPQVGKSDLSYPDEVAYLRGGEREVLRLHLFKLVQGGFLEVIETRKWLTTKRVLAISHRTPPSRQLSESDQALINWFDPPQLAENIRNMALVEPLRSQCTRYRAKLEREGLLRKPIPRALHNSFGTGTFIATVVAFFIVPRPYNLCALGVPFAASFLESRLISRLTQKGRRRLREIQSRCETLKDRVRNAKIDLADPSVVIAVAVFGTTVLANSAFDAFAAAIAPGSSGISFGVEVEGGCAGCGDGCGGCGGCA